MKKLISALVAVASALLVSLTLVQPANAGSFHAVNSFPFGVTLNECIGGSVCGGTNNTINFALPFNGRVASITVFAHDQVAQRTNAQLQVLLDGRVMGSQDVKKDRSFLTFPLGNIPARLLQLRSVHKNGDPGGDETVVLNATILGS